MAPYRWFRGRHRNRIFASMGILYILQNVKYIKQVQLDDKIYGDTIKIHVSHMTNREFSFSCSYSEFDGLRYSLKCDCTSKPFICRSILKVLDRINRCQKRSCQVVKRKNNNKQYNVPRKGIRKREREKRNVFRR